MKLFKKEKKKGFIENFLEELGFVELSAQAKHLRASILWYDRLNDSPRYYCQLLHFQVTNV